ncbi:isopentenyl phosphate kinase-like, partial [Silene latifolia]|uniref:isopentenyl phosphate kinase-like n=1 Tax=Silene latifolia TaxID=37657 RepID=UPI003D772D63
CLCYLAECIPSIGISPFSSGWTTSPRNVASADIATVATAIDSGFVPVLHGDAVLDHSQGCTILSGDVIIRHIADSLKPEYVVFSYPFLLPDWLFQSTDTDVFGVYDSPPSEPDAILLREIAVDEDGSWSVINHAPETMSKQVEITVAAHDTTGSMVTKISEAAAIAKLGIDVYIVKATTDHSLKDLTGAVEKNLPDDWLGTAIRFKRE